MAGNHSSMVAVEDLESSINSIKHQWEVEFSRFFNFPLSLSSTSSRLKPLPKSRTRCRGTWMSSSSMASLQIVSEDSNPETILVVFLRGTVVEEHFTCNLNFSWPQVSCVTQCPTRGSRVVFASYRDCSNQIQKFAVRFPTSTDAQTFVNAMKDQPSPLRMVEKETFTQGMEIEVAKAIVGSEVSSQADCFSSDVVQYRPMEELNLVDHLGSYSPQIPALMDYNHEHSFSQEPLASNNLEGLRSGLPPSFTALLTNCSSVDEQVKPTVPEEADLKFQIARYMSDSSFHEMLTKVEEVINEIGGDLTL